MAVLAVLVLSQTAKLRLPKNTQKRLEATKGGLSVL